MIQHRVIRALGSLRLAAVLILMLLVAMAYATIYEQKQGLAQTRGLIYDSTWFLGILALIAINTVLAIAVRLPLNRRQIGFVITHLSILVILMGAVVSGVTGVRGHVTLTEGESTDQFSTEGLVLTLVGEGELDGPSVPVNLWASAPIENPGLGTLKRGGVTARAVRFMPDAQITRVKNDNPTPNLAIEVDVRGGAEAGTEWLRPGRLTKVGPMIAALKVVDGLDAVEAARSEAAAARPDADAYLEIAVASRQYPIALAPNLGKTVPIGDTGYAVEISKYLPHAQVRGRELVTVSDRPVNPAAVVYIVRDGVRDRRTPFAFHPGMGQGAGRQFEDVDVALEGIRSSANEADAVFFALPDGSLHVLFTPLGADPTDAPVTVGLPLDTPWTDATVTVTRRYDHARLAAGLEPVVPPRGEDAWPALEVEVTHDGTSEVVPVQRYSSVPVQGGGLRYRLEYRHALRPLGFRLTLEKFTKGLYPGTSRPRSFSSDVRIETPEGALLGGVVSMNAPLVYGGFSFYQTSYGENRGRMVSTLSVVRDPGMWIVFLGYVTAALGMIVVLVTRIQTRRQSRQPKQD